LSNESQPSRYVYLVRAEFGDRAQEEEWNRWYDGQHVPDLLSVPGFVSAVRFRERNSEGRYLALYEVEHPGVFSDARYRQVTGWGEWEQHIVSWQGALYEFAGITRP
jgi:hypothetical protein